MVQGYAWTHGIHRREQTEGLKPMTDAVHKAGGRIFLQLWNVGRISHPAVQPGTKRRMEDYLGLIENRVRMLLEVLAGVTKVWSANRVGVRLSPVGIFNNISDLALE